MIPLYCFYYYYIFNLEKTGDKEHGCSDCGGSSVNSNYAPVNTNVQNFVNIETEIDTNINVNMGGGKPMKPHGDKPNKGRMITISFIS